MRKMNFTRIASSWSLAALLHVAAAAGLGYLSNASDDTPDTDSVVRVDIILNDAPRPAAPEGGNAGESAPPLPAEPEPEPETVIQEEPEPLPELQPDPTPPEPVETQEPDAIPVIDEAPAEPAQPEPTISPAEPSEPGSGEKPLSGFGADVIPASADTIIRPVYPLNARRRGEEGKVTLEFDVSENGKALSPVIIESSGYNDLDHAAKHAVLKATFTPAKKDGIPIASRISLTFVFRLRD